MLESRCEQRVANLEHIRWPRAQVEWHPRGPTRRQGLLAKTWRDDTRSKPSSCGGKRTRENGRQSCRFTSSHEDFNSRHSR